MAKTYLDIVKYMVEAKFTINGMVDKPDIIGAVFGQTEGLLGDDLDLRELQKGGKIGRIEIELSQTGGRSYGRLLLPASLDRIETCILAAAVESVDRVGPYEAEFKVAKVEDTRSEKRRKILDRAKELVKLLLTTDIPDSRELSELVQSEVKVSEIASYGPENLPAGPEVGKSPELIIVEGRADVLVLLRNDVTNAIALGGAAAVPKSIIDLCREKETTVFLDGDRGGDLILRNLVNVADIDFVCRAPDGKEVEDLTRKEIIKSMRTKVPLDQYQGSSRGRFQPPPSQDNYQNRQQRYPNNRDFRPQQQQPPPPPPPVPQAQSAPAPRPPEPAPRVDEQRQQASLGDLDERPEPRKTGEAAPSPPGIERIESQIYSGSQGSQAKGPVLESMLFTTLGQGLDELTGTLRSRLYDTSGSVMREVPIRELLQVAQNSSNCYAIVLDGVITQRLVELAIQKGIKAIYGQKANQMQRRHPEITLYTKEDGKIE
ncbi:MAG TPA: DNA primase DnaG [Candidatus Saccharimonadales bacterium]|nr:DNA primase DnaG [Candidatus Saccharimonadales bacterium]